MRARPISHPALVTELAGRILATPRDRRLRVALDGAPPTRPEDLADRLVEPLQVGGRPVLRVSARDFLRAASLRYEFGRRNPDAYYDDWLDTGALQREVLGPLGPGGTGKALPTLWDSERDRATRAQYVAVPPGAILLLDGALLLGRGLPFDLTVHLHLSPPALARRTEDPQAWTLPAYHRYDRDVRPRQTADLAVKVDDPNHPALLL